MGEEFKILNSVPEYRRWMLKDKLILVYNIINSRKVDNKNYKLLQMNNIIKKVVEIARDKKVDYVEAARVLLRQTKQEYNIL